MNTERDVNSSAFVGATKQSSSIQCSKLANDRIRAVDRPSVWNVFTPLARTCGAINLGELWTEGIKWD